MRGTFYGLDQVLHIVVAQSRRQTQWPGANHEWLSLRFSGDHQPHSKKVVHRSLQRGAGSPDLAAKQFSHVFIKRECGSHILMIADKTS